MPDEHDVESFDDFFHRVEPRLRMSLSATFGLDAGRQAASDALSYGWENWERVSGMENPVGYLYVIGRDRGRDQFRKQQPAVLIPVERESTPWVEPELPGALSSLPEQQRVAVMLLHCFEWSMSEVAELLGVSKSTVQTHVERGMAQLRSRIGVPQ